MLVTFRLLFAIRTVTGWLLASLLLFLFSSTLGITLGYIGGHLLYIYMTLIDIPDDTTTRKGVVVAMTLAGLLIGLATSYKLWKTLPDGLGTYRSELLDYDQLEIMRPLGLIQPRPPFHAAIQTLKTRAFTIPISLTIGIIGSVMGLISLNHHLLVFLFVMIGGPSAILFLFLPRLQQLRFLLTLLPALAGGVLGSFYTENLYTSVLGSMILLETLHSRWFLFEPQNDMSDEQVDILSAYSHHLKENDDKDLVAFEYFEIPFLAGTEVPIVPWDGFYIRQDTTACKYLWSLTPSFGIKGLNFEPPEPKSAHERLSREALAMRFTHGQPTPASPDPSV